jgi:hypothetical protein
MGFSFFLKRLNPSLYKEYVMEKFREENNVSTLPKVEPKMPVFKKPRFKIGCPALKKLDRISSLNKDHFARQYVEMRKIPERYFSNLYYTSDFGSFIKDTKPEKYSPRMDEQDRLLIPFFSEKGEMIAYQGRVFGKLREGEIRYITITLDEDGVKLFGLDKLNTSKEMYILEGPIDSMFVRNSVALAGSSKHVDFKPETSVFVFDNERRSVEIVKQMQARVHDNYGIFIWPDFISQKDINELAMNGYDESDIMKLLRKNTYRGLAAEMKINTWKRI